MFTREKQELINECIMLSRQRKNVIYYGFICKDGSTHATANDFCIKERILEGSKIYCKAQDGYLIL